MAYRSSRARMQRLQAEKAIENQEKEERRRAKEAAKATGASRKPAASKPKTKLPMRRRLVWVVCNRRGEVVKQFEYKEKAEAEAEMARLIEKTDQSHFLRSQKVALD